MNELEYMGVMIMSFIGTMLGVFSSILLEVHTLKNDED